MGSAAGASVATPTTSPLGAEAPGKTRTEGDAAGRTMAMTPDAEHPRPNGKASHLGGVLPAILRNEDAKPPNTTREARPSPVR